MVLTGVILKHFYFKQMPGIDEELMFRGILLCLCNRSFGKNWVVFGAEMGWGSVIIITLFGLVHGLEFDENMKIQFNPINIIVTGITGFIFTWGKERCGSILPSIFGHNLFNFVQQF